MSEADGLGLADLLLDAAPDGPGSAFVLVSRPTASTTVATMATPTSAAKAPLSGMRRSDLTAIDSRRRWREGRAAPLGRMAKRAIGSRIPLR